MGNGRSIYGAGSRIQLIGCIGNDDEGLAYQAHLDELGVHQAGLVVTDSVGTGAAFITVEDTGENTIVVHPGANHALTPKQVESALNAAVPLDGILMQLECPLTAVQAASNWAQARGVKVLLNPSPCNDALNHDLPHADVWIVNETEAAHIPPATSGLRIVTRGAKPTQVFEHGTLLLEAAPPAVQAIDTVGAGDAFAGAFAEAYLEGQPLEQAIAFANAAGALATQQLGAQTAIPTRDEICAFQQRQG